jgi:parvulin-like peptidyl-prolyl isomerase
MVRALVRQIPVLCVMSLYLSSCGSSDEAVSERSPSAEQAISTDSMPDIAAAGHSRFMRASHILITWGSDFTAVSEADALVRISNIQDEILSGRATFEEMAFNHSDCTSAADSGRLPAFTAGAVTEELDSTVCALEPGEMSGIVRTRFGYHLVKRLEG